MTRLAALDTREERKGCCVETDLKDSLLRGFLTCLQKSFWLKLSSGGYLLCRATLESKDRASMNWTVAVQSRSRVQLFVTPWTSACQASMSFTISQSLLKLMSIDSVMPSNHLILFVTSSPSVLTLSHHQDLFQWVGSSHQAVKALALQLQHQSFQWTFTVDLL